MFSSKKGGVTEAITTYYTYIAIVVTILVAFYVFTLSTKTSALKITSEFTDEINLNTNLLGLLRSPVVVDNTKLTIADLIVLAERQNCYPDDFDKTIEVNYCKLIESNIKEMLKSWDKDWNFYISNRLVVSKFYSVVKEQCGKFQLPYQNKDLIIMLCAK